MTEDRRFYAGDTPRYILLDLESSFQDNLGQRIVDIEDTVAPSELSKSRTFANVLESVADATHLLIELDYFDADFRSVLALTLSRTHDPLPLRTDRLLFLRSTGALNEVEDSSEMLRWLKDTGEASSEPHAGAEAILGYVVLNGDPGGMIGRSLLPPPRSIPQIKGEVPIERRVRTGVRELISVAGRLVPVFGVPFMSQDGNVLTCAHVVAWMVHYNAALRGLSRRRHADEFHRIPGLDVSLVAARNIPSQGLTAWQISTLLDKVGLPAEVVDEHTSYQHARFTEWYDRPAVRDFGEHLLGRLKVQGPSEGETSQTVYGRVLDKLSEDMSTASGTLREAVPESEEFAKAKGTLAELEQLGDDIRRFWIKENLTAAVCRQLNSGFPAIVMSHPHAWVVNGYLRNRDLASEPRDATGAGAFIISDDQRGPYVPSPVGYLADSVASGKGTVLLPLPPGIWMSGFDAERLGAKIFEDKITSLLPIEVADDAAESRETSRTSQAMTAIQLLKEKMSDFQLAVRSYIVTGTDFKRGLARRCKSEILEAEVSVVRLPKFVWVIEVMDRPTRENGDDPAVHGEVVLDASNLDERETIALITHLPGFVQVATGDWRALESHASHPYRSGRYHFGKDWLTDAATITTRAKYSV